MLKLFLYSDFTVAKSNDSLRKKRPFSDNKFKNETTKGSLGTLLYIILTIRTV